MKKRTKPEWYTPPRITSALLALLALAFAPMVQAADEVNIARLEGTTKKVVNSSGVEGEGFAGGTGLDMLFDGNLLNTTRLRRIGNGGYIQVDFSEPCFVTTVNVTKWYRHKYSLSTSSDGETWVPVDYATAINRYGTKQWGVYAAASHVRMSFPEGGNNCPDVSEVEVWGSPVSTMTCSHVNTSSWEEVLGSATCTTPAIETKTCLDCGQTFMRESGGQALGHDYIANVVRPGKGWFSCSRCDFKIDCYEEDANFTSMGGMPFDDTCVMFSKASVSSFVGWIEESGESLSNVIDNDLSTGWTSGYKNNSDYVEITFATSVLLKKVEVTIPSGSMKDTVQIYKVDGSSETLLWSKDIFQGDSIQTIEAELDGSEVDVIRVKVPNNWWSYEGINEVRAFGTVPGPVNYNPVLILMQ